MNIKQVWNNAHNITPKTPICIDIELSTACNLKCGFCFLSNKKYKNIGKFINFDLAKSIINEVIENKIPNIKLNWRGESTLHPLFNEIAAYIKENKKYGETLINTNGQLFKDGLLYCDKVFISLDSCREGTYKKIRKGGDLNKSLGTIQKLLKHNHKYVELRRVICPENDGEDFKADCFKLFGNAVKVEEHFVFDRSKLTHFGAKRIYCKQPSQRIIISVDGNMYPCCVSYMGNKNLYLGNFSRKSILQTWKSEKLKNIRHNLKNNIINFCSDCKNCSSYSSYDCKENEVLKAK